MSAFTPIATAEQGGTQASFGRCCCLVWKNWKKPTA